MCKHHYHLPCLDPPLAKMPKIGTREKWMCADCAFPSDEEEEKEESIEVVSMFNNKQTF